MWHGRCAGSIKSRIYIIDITHSEVVHAQFIYYNDQNKKLVDMLVGRPSGVHISWKQSVIIDRESYINKIMQVQKLLFRISNVKR